jgi:WD40 repeat protein
MQIDQINTIPVIGIIRSLDYDNSTLVLSLSPGSVYIYSTKDLLAWELTNGLSKIPEIEVLKFYSSLIISGNCEGELTVMRANSSRSLDILYTQRIHTDIIKDLAITSNCIYTCGIDNYINALIISTGSIINLIRVNRIQAHKGWVTGIAITDEYLVSQGSDDTVNIWTLQLDKVAEIRYIKDDEDRSIVKKPSGKGNWFLIAGTQSQVTGEGCITVINAKTVQVIEIPFTLCTNHHDQSLKRTRLDEIQIEVQCSVFNRDCIVVAAAGWVFIYTFPQIELAFQHRLENDTEINVSFK